VQRKQPPALNQITLHSTPLNEMTLPYLVGGILRALRAEHLGKAGTFSKAFSSALLLLVLFEFDTCGEPEALGFSRFDV